MLAWAVQIGVDSRVLLMLESDLRTMHRLVTGPDGLERLLGWLQQRLAGNAALVDHDGAAISQTGAGMGLPAEARSEFLRLVEGRCDSAAVYTPKQMIQLVAIGEPAPFLLILVSDFANSHSEMVSDAARLLALRWRLDRAEELDRRNRDVKYLSQELILYFLMSNRIEEAFRVAKVINAPLPKYVRVYIIESPFGDRDKLASRCELVLQDKACVVRCPVYNRHLLIMMRMADLSDDSADLVEPLLRSVKQTAIIGAGCSVSLGDIGFGYTEAFHALTLARDTPGKYVRLKRRDDLSAHMPSIALHWSRCVLSPLIRHAPARPQDPDSAELIETLRSWLDFRGSAYRQLNIHRNTLKARIGLIGELLDRDLHRIDNQAELHLALRLARRSQPTPTKEEDPVTLAELLQEESIAHWSSEFLRPLLKSSRQTQALCQTVRTWLATDAQVERAANVLGVSAPAVRRRLTRVERMLGRSLLGAPSARFDLILALRSLGLSSPPYA